MHEFQRRPELGVVLQPLLDQVFDRLDVVVGGALDLLDPRGVGDVEKPSASARRRAAAAPENGASSTMPGSAASASSHSTSTLTRARIRPYSEKIGRSASTLPA